MPTYTAYFRCDTEWAEREFTAATPQQALRKARKFYKQSWGELAFQTYDSSCQAVDEIEVCDAEDDPVALWQSDDLLLRIAAPALLESARKVVARWEKGDLAEAVRELDAAIAQAAGAAP